MSMVGLVIVAHSAELAESVKALAEQVAQGQVRIAAAGGVDDPRHPFGTDATKVAAAIRRVYSDDGVVVLMDLGSAVLSAEMALELLSPEERERVVLCDAPLVEGAIAAAVQAAAGARLEEVVAEARAALAGKQAQIRPEPLPSAAEAEPEAARPEREVRVVVPNPLGLHARPAAQFVATASRFQATITVRNVTRNTGPANAKSINQLATLGVRQGDEIAISAHGPDADAALAALKALVESGFGELEIRPEERMAPAREAAPPTLAPNVLQGVPASPGIAVGPAHLYRPALPEVPVDVPQDPAEELARLERALAAAKQDLQAMRSQAQAQLDAYTAALFDAHLLFLEDPALVDRARQLIREGPTRAEKAWQQAVEEVATAYDRLDDPYLRQRAADVRDVGQRVLRLLAGAMAARVSPEKPSILVAEDLLPSDVLNLDPARVLGICTAFGGATSHAAILARAVGIPAVVGLGVQLLAVREEETIALDGERGLVWLHPTPEQLQELTRRREAWVRQREARERHAHEPAVTKDGRRVGVWANIAGIADARAALHFGAEGVGLFRTEFLYLDRAEPPGEEEQIALYRDVLNLLGDKPCVIRTLDVGGDKPVPYLHLPQEANPFLGWRGIRLALDFPDLFKTQVRAILRAAADSEARIMFPMVSTLEEVEAAQSLLAQARRELEEEGHALPRAVRVGIMVETPAAALLAPVLARRVAFFSLGTNDLTQYTMAADRTNERVARLADPLAPPVLHLIAHTVAAGHEAGISVSVCGEMAADLEAVPVLVGLGIDVLSMNPPAVPQVKALIRGLDYRELEALAAEALKQPDATSVRRLVREYLARHALPSTLQ